MEVSRSGSVSISKCLGLVSTSVLSGLGTLWSLYSLTSVLSGLCNLLVLVGAVLTTTLGHTMEYNIITTVFFRHTLIEDTRSDNEGTIYPFTRMTTAHTYKKIIIMKINK